MTPVRPGLVRPVVVLGVLLASACGPLGGSDDPDGVELPDEQVDYQLPTASVPDIVIPTVTVPDLDLGDDLAPPGTDLTGGFAD